MFFQYAVNYASASPSAYTITAAADIDGDTVNQVWGYVKPVTGTTTGIAPIAAHGVCTATGIAGNQLTTVGPCAATHGQTIF